MRWLVELHSTLRLRSGQASRGRLSQLFLFLKLFFAGEANPFFHLIEVLRQGAAARGGEAVVGARDAAFEIFQAGDVFGLFEFAGVNAEVAVGGFENAFEIVEAEAFVGGESADDSEAHALVNQTIEFRERNRAGRNVRARWSCGFGLLAPLGQRSSHHASGR